MRSRLTRPDTDGVDLAPEVVDVTVERDADDGTDGHCLEPGSDLQGLGQREVSRSQFGVGDCHFERGGQLPIYRRIPEELGHLGPERKRTASGPAGAEEAGHAPGPGGLLHVGHRRIDGGGLGQSRALAPPLTFVGHDPDEEHGARPMHTNRRADVPHERDLDPDKFYAVQLHVLAARITVTVDRSLYAATFWPGWRNGRRGGLKSRCPKGRVGSNPTPGTARAPRNSLEVAERFHVVARSFHD